MIGENVKTIPAYAFYNCSGLTGELKIPDSVTSIGGSAFYWCRGLESVTIGSGVTSIGTAFSWCTGLKSVTIGSGVTSIGREAFYECSGLTSITIPDGVTSIGNYAFENCSGLTSITIPDGVTSIGNYAFDGCSGLKSVYFKGTPTKWKEMEINSGNTYLTSATRFYFSAETPTAEQWQESENWWHYAEDGTTIVLWTKDE